MGSIKSIAFLHNKKSQSGVLESFTKGLQEAFGRLGVTVASYDFEDFESGEAIPKIVETNPDCTLGFNILLPEDSPLKPVNIPHYAPLCDCATYYPELRLSNHMLASFMEQDSYGFYKKLGVENVFFLPHAISASELSSRNQSRDLDVVMAGSFVFPEAIYKIWQEQLSPDGLKAMVGLAEKVLASPHISHLQAFMELVEQLGPFEKELMDKKLDFFSQLNLLEVYIRNTDRLRMIQNIKNHTVHIFTAKSFMPVWKDRLKGQTNLEFHDEVPFDQLGEIFSRAKCVINSIPTIKRGLHERLLLALAKGASVLTSENIFISSQFAPSKAILNVLSPNYATIDAQIAEACKDEEARFKDVLACQQVIQSKHTWDARAKTLMETLPPFLKRL
ncbi:MAG: glycosyltransferase family 1 protein [Verrucomicrobia bacterium]|nr:glycosyltransferase family 1 protein [Verrucomicrobiota bacterium]MBS0636892.1 glycosyltransferase family 1 protein [Verrucomicrobiota bacterium]